MKSSLRNAILWCEMVRLLRPHKKDSFGSICFTDKLKANKGGEVGRHHLFLFSFFNRSHYTAMANLESAM